MISSQQIRALRVRLSGGVRLVVALSTAAMFASCGGAKGPSSYALNVYVTGLMGPGLRVTLNGGAPISIFANAQTTLARLTNGATYIVAITAQPVSPLQTCTAANPSGTITDNNVDVMISCVAKGVVVPSVLGMTQPAASTAITGVGLAVGAVSMQRSATVAAGLVISESPAAGTSVASGSAVSLVISSGLPHVAVPNVAGLGQAAAATAISGVGLKVGAVTMQSSSTVAAGLVISESPSAGTSVASGSEVNIVVSSGASPPAGTPNSVIDAPASVLEYATVALNGSYSTDPTASIQRYAWKQISGPSVALSGATTSQASFTAPPVTSQTSVVFTLTITDTTGAISTAKTTVTVSPATPSQLHVSMVSALLFSTRHRERTRPIRSGRRAITCGIELNASCRNGRRRPVSYVHPR